MQKVGSTASIWDLPTLHVLTKEAIGRESREITVEVALNKSETAYEGGAGVVVGCRAICRGSSFCKLL